MNTTSIYKVAKALLYEGYMLYPYRASSVKNRQRFNFGVLYPRAYSEQQEGSDRWFSQTECLVVGNGSTTLEVRVRFLHLMEPAGSANAPEAVEREVVLPALHLHSLIDKPLTWHTTFTADEIPHTESTLADVPAAQRPVRSSVVVIASQVAGNVFRVTLQTKNAALPSIVPSSRDEVLLYSLISAHTVLGVESGEFVSLLEPPDELRAVTEECRNIGVFPVLAGERPQRNMMLSSPIILYDYPEVAPESAGDLFDSTEIDEILSLRIMTLTDSEKEEVRNSGDRARAMLESVENLPEEHLLKLHGVLRGLRPIDKETHQ